MLGVKFTLETTSFCTFRVPTSTSIVRSYPVPPFTTVRGMLSNAKGLPRDDFLLQKEDLKIGIKTAKLPVKVVETARILKYIARDAEKRPLRRVFPSSPMRKEILLKPAYVVFLVGNDALIASIYESLINPSRPLYLGQSDDFVDIASIAEPVKVDEKTNSSISSMIEGIYPRCEVVRLPYKYNFNGEASITYKTFSLPSEFPYKSPKEISCYAFDQEYITAQ